MSAESIGYCDVLWLGSIRLVDVNIYNSDLISLAIIGIVFRRHVIHSWKSAKKRRTETTEDRLEDLDTTENTAEVNETSMMSLTIPRVETAVSSEVPESLATLSKFELQEREIAIMRRI